MLLRIEGLLDSAALAEAHARLARATFGDGRVTAGELAAGAKRNLQLPPQTAEVRALRELILAALDRSARFIAAALPRRVHPPLVNRYLPGMGFGAHIDNAVRFDGPPLRADLSATLFLCAPTDYDGGDLIIEDAYGERAVKLPAGDLVLYPSDSLHRVEPITRGAREVAVFWVQSLVRDSSRRRTLFEVD